MKSEYFKSQNSYLRGSREKEPPKSTNWDRIVYLTLLTVGVLVLLYYLIDYSLIMEGKGRVYVNQHSVRLPVDVRIQDMFVEEGDSVTLNDSLFAFRKLTQPETPQKQREDQMQLDEKLVELNGKISVKQAEIEQHEEQLDYYQSQKELVRNEIKLNLSSMRDLRDIERKIMSLKAEKRVDARELNSYYKQKKFIQEWKNSPEDSPYPVSFSGMVEAVGGEFSQDKTQNEETVFTAPVDGLIERVNINDNGLAMRSETILTIRRKATEVFIKIIFPRDSQEYLTEGETLKVKFHNGVTSRGIITSFYVPQISSWDAVGIAQYDINDYVICRLKPESKKEEKVWEKNSNVGVSVSKLSL